MEGILNIQSGAVFDYSIAHLETHAYQPYNNTSYNNSDEIRISIQNQEMNLLCNLLLFEIHFLLWIIRRFIKAVTLIEIKC